MLGYANDDHIGKRWQNIDRLNIEFEYWLISWVDRTWYPYATKGLTIHSAIRSTFASTAEILAQYLDALLVKAYLA